MAKITLIVTVSDDMSDTSLQELANAVMMWRNVQRVEVSKEAAQHRVQADECPQCHEITTPVARKDGFFSCPSCGTRR